VFVSFLGYIDMPVPFRKYDYQEYYPNMKSQEDRVQEPSRTVEK